VRTKFKSRIRRREQLTGVLFAGILLPAGAILIGADVVSVMLACPVVLVLTAITGHSFRYFYPGAFGRKHSLKQFVRPQHEDRAREVRVTAGNERELNPDFSMWDKRLNTGLARESPLDVAVERIVRGIQQDLEVRK
jgi:hypothetical protein